MPVKKMTWEEIEQNLKGSTWNKNQCIALHNRLMILKDRWLISINPPSEEEIDEILKKTFFVGKIKTKDGYVITFDESIRKKGSKVISERIKNGGKE